MRVSPDGTYVAASAGSGSGVRAWNLQTGEQVKHLSYLEESQAQIMEAAAWTPDGRYLFIGGNSGGGQTATKCPTSSTPTARPASSDSSG